jgi:putative ABC transport system permease protein
VRFGQVIELAIESFRANKGSFALTAMGMIIGSASVILVVTVGLTGKQYAMDLIEGIGANMIVAEYYGGGRGDANSGQDYLTVADVTAVTKQVPGIVAASPMLELHDSIHIGGGETKEVLELGVFPEYRAVRNLLLLSGRFLDHEDSLSHAKVAVVTAPLGKVLFGSNDAALGGKFSIHGIPFTIIGIFKERVNTFGQSEIAEQTVLLPYPVARYLTDSDRVEQLFFSVRYYSDIESASNQIAHVIHSRHRSGSKYVVSDLTALVTTAGQVSRSLTIVMLMVSVVTLTVGGVGIMNIMLATVKSRTHEIGIRKALGATAGEIQMQFLVEALFISLSGGFAGAVLALAIAFSIRLFTGYRVPISPWSILTALSASTIVGVVFGTLPARRAAQLDPVDALKDE